jgi:UDP-MurNAc hydroxylase
MHDWKWDLKTGRCLSTSGHPIRSTKLDRSADDVLAEAS